LSAAVALLAEAEAVGASLRAAGNGNVRAAGAPLALLARLREHKAELLELLTANACRHCGEVMNWPGPVGITFADGTGRTTPATSGPRPPASWPGPPTRRRPTRWPTRPRSPSAGRSCRDRPAGGPSRHPEAVKARRWRACKAAERRGAVTVALAVEPGEVADLCRAGLLAGDPYDIPPIAAPARPLSRRRCAGCSRWPGRWPRPPGRCGPRTWTQPMVPENRGEQGAIRNRGCAPARPPGEGRGHG
jgi:hypothetical protein